GLRVPDRHAVCIDDRYQLFRWYAVRVVMGREHVNMLLPVLIRIPRFESRDYSLNRSRWTSSYTIDNLGRIFCFDLVCLKLQHLSIEVVRKSLVSFVPDFPVLYV